MTSLRETGPHFGSPPCMSISALAQVKMERTDSSNKPKKTLTMAKETSATEIITPYGLVNFSYEPVTFDMKR